ncbi:Hypothetical predicted protein [Mytilus galloprovincialis]|uniref:SAM domain-containing protein n=1 Tax=Mytilus galloprovincialis TaxID=29158 RepID=A0A8B6DFH8_MYTGA|nr:Hypothetical predicted protein [Mytilus galloprovincialis]
MFESENEEIGNPMVELSDIDRVKKWAASKKVNEHSAAELIRLGYDSIEALSCLLPEDLTKSKIPIGQQRLLLRAVKSTFPAESGSESNMAANEQLPATSLQAQLNACATETIDGGAVQTGSGDIYVRNSFNSNNRYRWAIILTNTKDNQQCILKVLKILTVFLTLSRGKTHKYF